MAIEGHPTHFGGVKRRKGISKGCPLCPPCFAQHDSSLTLQRHACKDAHQGGSGAWTVRTYPPPVQHPNHVACTCDVVRRRFMGRTLWKTAHRRIGFPNAMHRVWGPFPTEGVRFRASPS